MNHVFLTADSFLALLAVVMNSVFAALVLFRTAKAIVYRTFLLICTATIIWNLGDFMVYATARQGWFYSSLIGTAMLPALMITDRTNGFYYDMDALHGFAFVHTHFRLFVTVRYT